MRGRSGVCLPKQHQEDGALGLKRLFVGSEGVDRFKSRAAFDAGTHQLASRPTTGGANGRSQGRVGRLLELLVGSSAAEAPEQRHFGRTGKVAGDHPFSGSRRSRAGITTSRLSFLSLSLLVDSEPHLKSKATTHDETDFQLSPS